MLKEDNRDYMLFCFSNPMIDPKHIKHASKTLLEEKRGKKKKKKKTIKNNFALNKFISYTDGSS